MTPCGVLGEAVDTCDHCADDCPASGHDGRTCTGGCTPCTCGRHEVDWTTCPHMRGHRGSAWCRLSGGACPVAWKIGPCVKEGAE